MRTKQEQRDPAPSAGIVDSQSVKGADTVPAATRGYDAGKKINGRKRHIVVDTIGLLLIVMVSAASVQDRDGGRGILGALHRALGSVRHVFADGGYRGQLVAVAKSAWGDRRRSRPQAPRPSRLRGAAAPLGRRAHLLLADAPPTPRARLRTPARHPRSDRQVGDGGHHAQPPRTTTRPKPWSGKQK